MRVALVHHADAVGPEVDPQRPLSTRGQAQARQLAERLNAARSASPALAGWTPVAIWHSGKLRARQTAEAFLLLNPFAEFKMVRGLRPDDPAEIFAASLAEETRDLIAVSHMPFLPALRSVMSAGGSFPLHGLVVFDHTTEGWRELLVLGGDL